jgi:hypothetical protein
VRFLGEKTAFSQGENNIFRLRKQYFPPQKTLVSAVENDSKVKTL